jgi:MFS family permease
MFELSNYIYTCPPGAGWNWLIQGIQLLRKKPKEMLILGNTYLFFILFMSLLIPILGSVIVSTVSPAMGFGIMLAGYLGQKGSHVGPKLLFSAFTPENRKYLQSLIILGAAQTACFVLISLLAHLLLGTQPTITVEDWEKADLKTNTVLIEYIALRMAFVSLASMPVLLAFWFAPVMIVWHNMKPLQAVFSSSVAVWRNKNSFFVYGIGLMLMSLALGALSIGLTLLSTLLYLAMPFVMVINMICASIFIAVFLSTLYPTYTAIFEHKSN